MCFCKTRQSKVLRAKRDIVVYKIGAYADKYTFVPYYVNNYTYKTGIQCQTCPDFKDDFIVIGFHGYINIRVSERLYPSMISIHKNIKKKSQIHVYLIYGEPLYLGKFIVPKGAIYCLNCNGEVISDGLMYTGNHILIKEYKTYNSKELWKEK